MKLSFDQFPAFKRDYLPANLEALVNVSCEPETNEKSLHFLQYEQVYGSVGVHPHNAKEWTDDVERWLEHALQRHPQKLVAVGECGLDYHYMHSPKDVQQRVFVAQIKLAVRVAKPLVVHSREAEADTLRLLQEHLPRSHRVHVHCFTSSAELARPLLADFPNLKIGFTGVITFAKTPELRQLVRDVIPLERLLLETDAPYMAPQSQRGKICHSGMIPETAATVGELKGVSLDDVLRITRENARQVYGI